MKKFERRYKDIITTRNLLTAWEAFLSGKRKRVDVILFQSRLMDNLLGLRSELLNRTYVHGGYTAFNISDPKPRNIHKAAVRDRMLHHLLYQELYGYFDSKFIHDSYSCRLGKGTHKAMLRFREYAGKVSKNNTRTCWVLKCDIRKFFANIDHGILKGILAMHIVDSDLLWLFDGIIDSFPKGLPLGNLTSQLLVNVYMNEFDRFIKKEMKIRWYIRYADDFVVLSDDEKFLEDLIPKISDFLEGRLKLSLHPDKVFIKTFSSGVDFLGWVHFPHNSVLRTTTKNRMLTNVRGSEGRPEVINSYKGILSHGNGKKLARAIDALSPKARLES
jgi:RNA-directed DNA polymerase